MLLVLFLLFSTAWKLPRSCRDKHVERRVLGLHKSRKVVLKLTALFSLDAFAGGLMVQSMMAFWFNVRFGVEPACDWQHFLWRQYPGRNFRPAGRRAGQADRV